MNGAGEEPVRESQLPGILEFFRAISGLAALAAISTLTLAGVQLGDSFASGGTFSQPSAASEGVPPPRALPVPPAGISSLAPATPLTVFYLVETAEEAATADWMEATSAQEALIAGLVPNWSYHVLYIRDAVDAAQAQQTIFEHLLAAGPEGTVQIADMRGPRDDH